MLCFPVPPIFSPSAHFFEHAIGKLTRRQAGPWATRYQNLQRSGRSAVARRAKTPIASSIPKPAADVAPRCCPKFPAPTIAPRPVGEGRRALSAHAPSGAKEAPQAKLCSQRGASLVCGAKAAKSSGCSPDLAFRCVPQSIESRNGSHFL